MDTVNLYIAGFVCLVAVNYILMLRARRQSRLMFRNRVNEALKHHVNAQMEPR